MTLTTAELQSCFFDIEPFFRLMLPEWRRSGTSIIDNADWQLRDMERDSVAISRRDEHGVPVGGKYVIAEPREHAKTTRKKAAMLWAALNGHRHYVVSVCESLSKANAELAQIMRIFEDANHPIVKNYGLAGWAQKAIKKPGLSWSTQRLMFPALDGDVSIIEAASPGQNLRGKVDGQYRPDLVMIDDPEDRDEVRNPELRAKLQGWLDEDVMQLGQSVLVYWIGTVLHYDSVLMRLLKSSSWKSRRYSALDENDMPIWPQKWPRHVLIKKRDELLAEGKARVWWQEFMNRPLDTETCMFPANAWNVYGSGIYTTPPSRNQYQILVIGADTANSTKQSADYSVFEAWGLMADGTFHLVEAVRGRWDWHTLMTMAIAMNERLRPDVWCVEKAASGQQLIQEFQRLNVPVEAVEATSDLVARAQPLQPAFAQRLLWRPANGFDWLTEEFEMFPNAPHDDSVAAAIAAWRRLVYKRPIRIYV